MQLVAYGAQDIYLTGNPQITFFKVVYRRHTNFSMETIEQTINGASAVAASSGSGTVTISRNGDLVHKVYVTSSTSGVTDGDSIVDEVELEIGGQRIDRHYKEWNQIWNELTTNKSKAVGLKSMKGSVGSSGTTGVGMVQVPLQFWFCRNPGLALPLIALQYHEVKLKFTWGAAADVTSGGLAVDCKVVCDYIYLDTDERRRFAQVSHEYLIEQIQRQSADASKSVKLNFNHPVKELIWTSNATNAYNTAQLKLNGHDRFSAQEEEYFQLRQPFDYHTAVPAQNLPQAGLEVYRPPGTEVQFTGHTADGVYDGHNVGTTNGNLLITATTVTFEGAGVPGFTTNFAGGFNLVIIPVTVNTDTVPSVVGKRYYVSVGASAANVAVDTNAIALTTTALPTAHDGQTLKANASVGGTYRVLQGADNTHINNQARTSQMTKKINVYSFALKPEEHQPSGTCNFSRIDTAKLDTNVGLEAEDNIYAVNYNVLRIMSGMGGLAYSN